MVKTTSSFPPSILVLCKSFRWRTQDGRLLYLHEMDTKHIFNSMKMIFNHIAEAYGATPIWYQHSYSGYKQAAKDRPKDLARTVVLFCCEIERRGDLPIKYLPPYAQIMKQILGIGDWLSDVTSYQPYEPVLITSGSIVKDMADTIYEKHGWDDYLEEIDCS